MNCSLNKTLFQSFLLFSVGALCAQTNFKVDGMGFFKDRSLKNRLAFLQNLEEDQPADLDAALLEDSAFLLIEQLKRDGYLQPTIEAVLVESGSERRVRWTSPYSIQLEAGAVADEVAFLIKPGSLAYYDEVEIEGVSAIDPEKLQRYFIPGGVLFQTRRARVFTPENLDRRIGRILQTLEAQGYRSAKLLQQEFESDASKGAVDVSLEFDQGPRHYVGSFAVLERRGGEESEELIEVGPNTLLTREWEQIQRSKYRNRAFQAGYPDANVVLESKLASNPKDQKKKVFDIKIFADWGEPATFSKVRFEGDEATRRPILRKRLDLEEGEPLNRLEVDKARRRLMGLGIYRHVAADLEPGSGGRRDVVYTLEPSMRKELKLLGGWGSYEQARAGFNWEHRNPFGRAHRYEIDAKQSLKSTRGQLNYYLPQVFASNIMLYSNLEYSFREEITYDRTKQGAAFGGSHTTVGGLRLAAEYGFFREEAEREDEFTFESEENATVSSVSLSISYDQRDDFLAPKSGWSVYSEFKIADRLLGGSVDFQKFELGGSYHFPVTESALIHIGLRGGSVFTSGAPERNIPFNERFFPGGENSLRGYREGEASPLDADGDQIGAENYALLNLEFEQRVYPNFSAVVFLDSTLNQRDGFGGETELLHSAGAGLRYQTVVGPVRVEYGQNLNPRDQDPDSTLHLSIGFPF